jgi:type IX secretion system PorP/SprF family membrane protein
MMQYFTRILVGIALTCYLGNVSAQDIHFSQFYSSPLTLNPAMTGNIAEHYRANFTYRNQWASIPAPYSTIAASVDASLLGCQLGTDHVGVGLALVNDRAGDGALNDLTAMLSAAYHKSLDQDRRYVMSLGAQMAFTQKSLNIARLYFQSQIDEGYEFNPALANLEPFQNNSFNYLDFRAGGLFTAAVNEAVNLYAGAAYFHLTKPKETFLLEDVGTAADELLDPRIVFHGGGSFFLAEKFSLSPSLLFMSQTGARNLVFGTAFGYHFDQGGRRYKRGSSSENSAIYLGGWYRLDDAIIFNIGIDYQAFKFGFSYDVNVSDLRSASLGQGALELTLSYSGRMSECKRRTPTYCPRF